MAFSRVGKALAACAAFATNLHVILAVAILTGAGCAIAGVSILVGLPWALLAAASICFVLAWIILRGMNG